MSLLLQDKQEVFTSLYTMKWFFQCFLDRVSTSLLTLPPPAVPGGHVTRSARADPVHAHPQDLGHLHAGRGAAAASHVLHHPQDAQK